MATGHLAMGRVWASVNRLIANDCARSDYLRNCNHIRPRCVVYRRYNRAHGPRARANGPSKAGLRRFSGGRQSFFKSHPPAKSGPVIGRRDSGCYHCDSAVFSSLFFFLFCFLFLCLSLCLSLVFPLLCPSITSQFRQTAWKTTTHDLWGALCAVLFPETFGQLRWTICGFVRFLANYGWKISDGWVSVILCEAMGILNFWVVWRSNLWIFVFLDTII